VLQSPLSGTTTLFAIAKVPMWVLPWKNPRQVTTMAMRASVFFSGVEILAG